MSRFKFLKSLAKGKGLKTLISSKTAIGVLISSIATISTVAMINANATPEEQIIVKQSVSETESTEAPRNFIDITEKYKIEKSTSNADEKVDKPSTEETEVVVQSQEENYVEESPVQYEEYTEVATQELEPQAIPQPQPEPAPEVPQEEPIEETETVTGPVFTYTSEVVVPEGLTSNDVLHGYINLVAIDSQGIDRSSEAQIYKGAPTPDGRVFFSFGVYLDGVMHQGKVFYTFG